MTHYYDKEHTKKIESYYDPCYRTGEFYSVNYLNKGHRDFDDFDVKTETDDSGKTSCTISYKGNESFEYSDTLYAIVNRGGFKPIYFVDSEGNELILLPTRIIIDVERQTPTFEFVEVDSNADYYQFGATKYIYDNDGDLIYAVPDMNTNKGRCLVSYSFISNYNDMEKDINPDFYKNSNPMSEEEKDIVKHRMNGEPFYKSDSYGAGND